MRFTIERIRTLILVCGVLLVVALGAFLTIGHFKSPFSRRDVPKRLGIDIQQEANGVTYTQAHGGHTLFKIHASRVVQLKNDHALLHDVQIELYGTDGRRVDRIAGDEFEYDQKVGTATAAGPVEITLMRPGVTPAVAEKAKPQQALTAPPASSNATPVVQAATAGEIHVKTSGISFDQKSGMVTTAQRVDFSMAQGSGSSIGASYDSQQGFLVLDHDVQLTARPTAGRRGAGPVEIRAARAEFYRDTNLCVLRTASTEYRGDRATAANAQILFRDDGSAVRLEAAGGFTLASATGSHLAAPTASMDFDEDNQPTHGHLDGGVTMDSASNGRTVRGTSPTMELAFASRGELRHAHLERGVEMHSEETSQSPTSSQSGVNGQSLPVHLSRTWRSPVVDVDFRAVGQSKVEPATIHGTGGVILTGSTQRGNAVPSPSKLSADEVTAQFGPNSSLLTMTGNGHASLDETSATGTHDFATGDRLEAHFASSTPGTQMDAKRPAQNSLASGSGATEIQSAALDGNVVLIQQPAAKPGAAAPPEMRANAGHAAYEGAGEWLHLTGSPRVDDGGLQLSADKIDVSRASGDAFAHGNVKGTWISTATANRNTGVGMNFGGQGPAHVIASEAQLHQATGEATFRGNARLWQQANSVAAPVIVLDRQKQTLLARTTSAANPVVAVLVGVGAKPENSGSTETKSTSSSVTRIRGGELAYSDVDRKAVMQAGVLGSVTAQAETMTSVSDTVELQLAPAANHATGQAQVEKMTATGHVTVSSQGRRGSGEQLVYTGADGRYRLTGSAAAPPKLTDPARGTVTGEALIFNSRDDSVSIEGGAQQTRTETTAPR
ncbi:MAG TPA: LptA/OstA family protein [Terracidiphilus sp.]|nr:LptA/OstA family protein [Terracidiphilus sp.]